MKEDGHFTIVCLAYCKAWFSAEVYKRLSKLYCHSTKWRQFIFRRCYY